MNKIIISEFKSKKLIFRLMLEINISWNVPLNDRNFNIRQVLVCKVGWNH